MEDSFTSQINSTILIVFARWRRPHKKGIHRDNDGVDDSSARILSYRRHYCWTVASVSVSVNLTWTKEKKEQQKYNKKRKGKRDKSMLMSSGQKQQYRDN